MPFTGTYDRALSNYMKARAFEQISDF